MTTQVESTVEPVREQVPGHPRGQAFGRALLAGMLVLALAWTWMGRQSLADTWQGWFGPQLDATLAMEKLPDGPLARRASASAVWTGREVIIWGGYASAGNFTYRNHADGAAYDPATKTWRLLAKSPLSGREAHLAVWTGTEMLVWGGVARTDKGMPVAQDGAAYDPATDTWRRIASAPRTGGAGMGGPTGVLWGNTLAVVPNTVPVDDDPDQQPVLLYDLKADRWRKLVTPQGEPKAVAVYGDALAVAGVGRADRPWLDMLATPSGTPEELLLPSTPKLGNGLGLTATDRALVLLVEEAGGSRTTILRRTGDGWQVRDVPAGDMSLPVNLFSGTNTGSAVVDDRRVLMWGVAGLSAVDLDTGAFAQADGDWCYNDAATVWTGSQVVVWGGADCDPGTGPYATNHGRAYTVKLTT